uniref:ATP synthase subunit a n=1 Tax=Megachile sculpturalis TaxID=1004196 RepID=A0A0M4KYX5_9HYME|nr:ATP synthase F0 subunit 6 [Megachile sculpturalis]
MKLMNLFEIFDPSNSMSMSMNWFSILLILIIMPYMFWLSPNRVMILFNMFTMHMYQEFKMLTLKKYKINIIMFFNIMMLILIMNVTSLFPYIFNSTSQMSINLSIAFTMWTSFFIYSLWNKPLKIMAHMVPYNTPSSLMNFMSLIEFISKMIQPWTLSIRLTANMIAGHLLLTLISNFLMNYINILPLSVITIFMQNLLFILEFSVSIIQSYVFSILSLLYFIEMK